MAFRRLHPLLRRFMGRSASPNVCTNGLYFAFIKLWQRLVVSSRTSNDCPMISNALFRWKLAIGLLAAVTLDTLLQLTWKSAVLETPDNLSPWATLDYVFANPLFIAMIAIMTFQFFNWLVVLGQADLSYAKPIAALSYASVPTMSVILLHEAIDIVEITGVALVLVGVWFISQTKSLTKNAPKLP